MTNEPMKLFLRTAVRTAIPALAVADIAYDGWWAHAAGNVFAFWATTLLVTGTLILIGYLADADYDMEQHGAFDCWTKRLYLTTALLLSVGAGWWWCVSSILLGWLFWAIALEAIHGESEADDTHAPIRSHHLN